MSHKPQPLPCLVAIAITLLYPAVKLAQSDISKNLRTPALSSKLDELADDSSAYLKAIWPNGGELARYGVSLSVVPPSVVEGAASWIRRIVKERWVPTEIDEKLIAMKDWKRRGRRVYPGRVAFGVTVDALMTEYTLGGYNFQIQDDGNHLGILVFPLKPDGAAPSIKEYLTGSIAKFLNVPPPKTGSLEYTLKHSQLGENIRIHYGTVWCEWDAQRNSSFEASKSQTWWNRMSVCTDGQFIFFSIPECLPDANSGRSAKGRTTEHNPRF
jgi:hypothetical protein